MGTWRLRITAVFAFAALAMAVLGGFGVPSAHASGKPHKAKGTDPDICYWINDATASRNIINTDGSVAGYYEVLEQHYNCTTTDHRAEGEIVITASSFTCTLVGFDITLYANGIGVEATGVSTSAGHKVGGSSDGCNYGTSYDLETSSYDNGSPAYCAEMTNVNFGKSLTSLKAGSTCP